MLDRMLRPLAVGAAGAAMAASAFAADITGAGSTFVYPILSQWSTDYNTKQGVKINYQSIGSGGGIAQIKAKTVDFGNSDKPLTPEELDQAGLVQFPQVIISITPVVNIDGVKPGDLVIDGPTLADIFLGKITDWDDPAIKKLNPSVQLPSAKITTVHRSDGSGTTFNFTDYLGKVSPEWKQKVGSDTSVSWPTGVGGKGNAGVAQYVNQVKGAIGYVEYAYVIENKMTYTKMVNKNGKTLDPTMDAFQAAAANADFTKVKNFYLILTDQPGDKSWPITAATYMLMRKDYPAERNQAVLKFLDWCLKNGQKQAEALAYVPMPESVVKQIEGAWTQQLADGGKSIWPTN
jgi:phosphate transport system substrate-binding protein